MRCPVCITGETNCIDSRPNAMGRRRRYQCECGNRFSTIEVYGDGVGGGSRTRKPIGIAPQELVAYRNKWLEDFRVRLNRAVDEAKHAAANRILEPEAREGEG